MVWLEAGTKRASSSVDVEIGTLFLATDDDRHGSAGVLDGEAPKVADHAARDMDILAAAFARV
jgi:hypothetical protein